MSQKIQIKSFVQFPEKTTISKEQLDNVLFDILDENANDNIAYCRALIDKLISIPYAQLPDFFSYHSNLISDPIKWLNKFEKLISENEELFHSSNNDGRMMKCYTIIESRRKELEILRNRHKNVKPPMQYINAECEERYFSFREVKSKVNAMADYTDKIMFLTNEKFD